jgi:methionyl-tRNA formyltransferase
LNSQPRSQAGREKKKLAFFGTADFAVPGLEALMNHDGFEVAVVITQPDRPAGRKQELAPTPIKAAALQHRLPLLQPESIRKEQKQFLSALTDRGAPELGVVIAFGQIIPEAVLAYFGGRMVNVHASLLPRWRGAAPIQRAIMSGDARTGVCLMRMEPTLDTGPVFACSETEIKPEDDLASLHDRLAELGADLLSCELPRIASGSLRPAPQASQGVTYAHKIADADARIDWSRPAEEIERLIRALSPAPGAFTEFKGKRLKIFKAAPKWADEASARIPGQIAYSDRANLEVQCGDRALALLEVQLQGKKRLRIEDFLRGNSFDTTITFK